MGRSFAGDHGWQVEYLFAIGAASWIIHLGVVSLTFFIIEVAEPVNWAPVWYGVMLAGTGSLFLLSLLFRFHDNGMPQRRRVFGWLHSAVTTIIGLTWGGGAIACAGGDPETMLYYTLVLGGTALGAVSSQHSLMRSCMLSVWTSIPLLTLAHLLHDRGAKGAASAAMILLFGATLTMVAIRMRRFLVRNVTLSSELAARVEELHNTTKELSRARQRAEDSDISKSRLLAQASHDLRQPVHAIAMFVECLRDYVGEDEGKRLLARIDTSLAAVARLFRSLLDITALDVGSIRPKISVFPVARILGDVVRQSEELAREKGSNLRFVETAAQIETDPALLHTMAQNLVSNAIKYGGRRILIGCRRRRGRLDIEVFDTGNGIPGSDQEKIFEEFVRLSSHGPGRSDGMGLGLSIVKRLAGLLDIAVSMESVQGRGTVFRISGLTERTDIRPAAEAGDRARRPMSILDGYRVSVIDDDDGARDAMATLLQRWGCSVRTYAGVPSPTDIEQTDFLLIDQDLGQGISGLDIVRELAGLGRRNAAIITGILRPEVEMQARQLGVVVLIKPVLPAQLRSLLLTAASRHGHDTVRHGQDTAAAGKS